MWNIQRMSFYVENLHLYNNFFVRVLESAGCLANQLFSVLHLKLSTQQYPTLLGNIYGFFKDGQGP